jgi:hypothetical protein
VDHAVVAAWPAAHKAVADAWLVATSKATNSVVVLPWRASLRRHDV